MVAHQWDREAFQIFHRAAPPRELRKGGFHLFFRLCKLSARFGKTCINFAGLTRVANCPAERFDVPGLFQLGPFRIELLDLVLMTGDRPLCLVSLTTQLGKPLSQHADKVWFISSEP